MVKSQTDWELKPTLRTPSTRCGDCDLLRGAEQRVAITCHAALSSRAYLSIDHRQLIRSSPSRVNLYLPIEQLVKDGESCCPYGEDAIGTNDELWTTLAALDAGGDSLSAAECPDGHWRRLRCFSNVD
jgi:hypothetical protein